MAQLSIFRFYYVWSMLLREEHFNSNQEEYKKAFLLRVLVLPRILHLVVSAHLILLFRGSKTAWTAAAFNGSCSWWPRFSNELKRIIHSIMMNEMEIGGFGHGRNIRLNSEVVAQEAAYS